MNPSRIVPCATALILALIWAPRPALAGPSKESVAEETAGPAVVQDDEDALWNEDVENADGERPKIQPRDWSQIRGVNYIPSYAQSSYACWMEYDGETIGRELAMAASLGFNSVRVWLNFNAYSEKPTPFLTHLSELIEACKGAGLTIMPILFDSTGVDRSQLSDGRETALDAYYRIQSRPDSYRQRSSYEKFLRATVEEIDSDRLVPRSFDPGVVYWGDWVPNPGHEKMGPQDWPQCRQYVQAIIGPFKDDPAIVAWDVMNEPSSIRSFQLPNDERPDPFPFVLEMIKAAREAGSTQPITVGAAGGATRASLYSLYVDVISLHIYQISAAKMRAELRLMKKRARGKPVILSEGGAVLFPEKPAQTTPEYQQRLVRSTVNAMELEKTGFYLWRLIEGKTRTPWAALLDSGGNPKLAARWLRAKLTRGLDLKMK